MGRKGKTKFEVFLEMYNQGKSREEIAYKINVKKNNISGYISRAKKAGLLRVNPKHRMSTIVALYKQGQECQEIADILHISTKTVNYYISRARSLGIIEKSKRNVNLSVQNVAKLYKENVSKLQISKLLELKESTVKYYIFVARKIGYLPKSTKTDTKTINKRKKYHRRHTLNSKNQNGKTQLAKELQKTQKKEQEEKINLISNIYGQGNNPSKVIEKAVINEKQREIVKLFFDGNYPGAIASILGIKKYVVYQCLEKENEKYKKNGKNFYTNFLSKNKYYRKLLKMKEEDSNFTITRQYLRQNEYFITDSESLDLADIYYILDDEYGMQRVLNINISRGENEESKNKLNMLQKELRDRRIRMTFKNLKDNGKNCSYDAVLTNLPGTKASEVVEIIGKSETIEKDVEER